MTSRRAGRSWLQPLFRSQFELTGARPTASELASMRCHRLAWALARIILAIQIMWISEFGRINELLLVITSNTANSSY